MSYPREFLNDDEEVVLDRHPHWSFMVGAVAMVVMSVIVTGLIAFISPGFGWVGLIAVLFALLGALGRYIRWRCLEFVVTTDRIIVRQGVLSKHGLEIPLDRVMNISFHQSVWERMLRAGDLVVESAGESGHQYFTDVADPAGVQNIIYRQAELAANGNREHGLGNNGKAQQSIPQQIAQLDELRERGIISPAEFEAKKQQLLDRM